MLTRIVVITLILLVVASLFSALFQLSRQKGPQDRVVRALTIRVALSIGLFLLLIAGFRLGLIAPHALR